MRRVKRASLVSHSAEKMFTLVADIESYPEFLPWCSASRIDERDANKVIASLQLTRGGISRWFTTENYLRKPESMDIGLINGPFRHLNGGWRFRDIDEQGSEVILDFEFEFESFLVDLAFGRFFEQTCNTLVDAFVKRAASIYD